MAKNLGSEIERTKCFILGFIAWVIECTKYGGEVFDNDYSFFFFFFLILPPIPTICSIWNCTFANALIQSFLFLIRHNFKL